MATLQLSSGGARADISTLGAEVVRWSVDGSDLLWSCDPVWWDRTAPLLFPVVGRVRDGLIAVEGRQHVMPPHGFASQRHFAVVSQADNAVSLELGNDAETHISFPFAFRLRVDYLLAYTALTVRLSVRNPGPDPLPYALGLHPGFRWPLAGSSRTGHAVIFESPERPQAHIVPYGGLMSDAPSPVPLEGTRLPLDDALFAAGALVFLDIASRSVSLEAGDGATTVTLRLEDFPHLAVWSRPGAPFVCIEPWTGHSDPVGFAGAFAEKPSMRTLPPGATSQHAVDMIANPGGIGR